MTKNFLIKHHEFDENFYLNVYPDVDKCVKSGEFKSGYEHYLLFGKNEGRLSIIPQGFDAHFYLATNPDIQAAVFAGEFLSAEEHYARFGHKEGRRIAPPKISDGLGGGIFSQYTFRYPYNKVLTQNVDFGFSKIENEDDHSIIKRLVKAYNASIANSKYDNLSDNSGMWNVYSNYNRLIHEAAINENLELISKNLKLMFQTNLTHGIAMGQATAIMAKYAPEQFKLQFADRLLRLAEATGVMNIRSPEQGDVSIALDIDILDLIYKIENKTGAILAIPQVGGVYGCKIDDQILPAISLTHFYAADRLINALEINNINAKSAFEIGGGFGGLALFFLRRKPIDYVIFDLPIVNMIQGYYLLKSNLNLPVVLYGEQSAEPTCLKIMPWWKFFDYDNLSFDVAINQDSIPEMPLSIGDAYIKKISSSTRELFFSINQEQAAPNSKEAKQLVISELTDKYVPFKLISRNLFWLRDGYVEEIYKISH